MQLNTYVGAQSMIINISVQEFKCLHIWTRIVISHTWMLLLLLFMNIQLFTQIFYRLLVIGPQQVIITKRNCVRYSSISVYNNSS